MLAHTRPTARKLVQLNWDNDLAISCSKFNPFARALVGRQMVWERKVEFFQNNMPHLPVTLRSSHNPFTPIAPGRLQVLLEAKCEPPQVFLRCLVLGEDSSQFFSISADVQRLWSVATAQWRLHTVQSISAKMHHVHFDTYLKDWQSRTPPPDANFCKVFGTKIGKIAQQNIFFNEPFFIHVCLYVGRFNIEQELKDEGYPRACGNSPAVRHWWCGVYAGSASACVVRFSVEGDGERIWKMCLGVSMGDFCKRRCCRECPTRESCATGHR